MSDLQIVTGATGFIGGALVLELLRTTDCPVACGVRSSGDHEAATSRLQRALEHAARSYGLDDLLREISERCVAFPLDITERPDTSAVPRRFGRPKVFWQAAASLRYEERHRAQIFSDNVDGVRNMLALAAALGIERFNYFSTAYVAGKREGTILEQMPLAEAPTSNCYEQSKVAAERLVWGTQQLETRILRPSVVIGHSQTLAATSYSGLYGFLREVTIFRRKVRRRLGDMLRMRPLSVRLASAAPINFIPVDVVVRDAARVGLAQTSHRLFHLTNDAAPILGETLDALFDELGLARPRHVTCSSAFTSLDEALDEALAFYGSYMNSPKVFSRTHTDSVVGLRSGRVPLRPARMRRVAAWYLEHLAAQRPAPAEQPGALPNSQAASRPVGSGA